ncbi:MAG: class I SAM-dependent methyltransferase [Myxococcales bacterium]|nr:class I SAM-dependent methyltransferase [Myxococcales bacterium]
MTASRYYQARACTRPPDYEGAYWHVVRDPDGRERNRLEERALHLSDLAEELAFVRQLTPGRVLDVGCGLGFFLSGLSPAWERHGVELSTFAAERARQLAQVHVGTLESAHYPDEHFDLVIAHHVIEHVTDPGPLVLEMRRVLKKHGVLLLGTPDFDSGCARRFGERYRLLHDDTHVSLFSADGMFRFLRDHGFVVDRVSFPFFETRHFTAENLQRLFDETRVSPPFYGNFMTFYCRRPTLGALVAALAALGAVSPTDAQRAEAEGSVALDFLRATEPPLYVVAEDEPLARHVTARLETAGIRVAPGRPEAGARALLLDASETHAGPTLAIVDETEAAPGRALHFPHRWGTSRSAAQLAVVDALLAEL